MTTTPIFKRFGSSGISWLTIVLALLAVGTFLAISNPGMQYITPMAVSVGGTMESSGGGYTGAVPPTRDVSVTQNASAPDMNGSGNSTVYYPGYPTPYYGGDVPVTDAREFLKLNYNASMVTRDTQGLVRRVETVVRGHDGRIDAESSSPKYGYVSFAIPADKYEAFRAELEGLVDSRFLTVNISSQNLLPQKQSIEEQQKQADQTLADYTTARQRVVSAHTGSVQSLQAQIDADNAGLASLSTQQSTPQIQVQIQNVSNDLASLKKQLVNENASYSSQLSSADANIKYAQQWQKAVQTQDKTLLENVATVTGTVSIQWISLWDMALLYLPGYWIPAIFAALAFLSYLRDRRRFGIV